MSETIPMRLRAVALTAMAGLVLSPIAAQEAASGFADALLGRWNLSVESFGETYPSWLEVRLQTESQLMGRFVGRVGSVRHVADLSYENGRLAFRVPVQYEAGPGDLVFSGRLVDGRLDGTMSTADGRPLRWSGRRAPSLARDATPTWDRTFTLFNGRDLTGWRPRSAERAGCWLVEAEKLSVVPPCVDLITEQTFDDFELHLEFIYPQGSNSGVYLRGRYEVQIQDDAGKALDPLRMGSIYGFLAPAHDAARAAGEWQSLDITLVGRRVSVVLNDATIIDDLEIPGITGGALDSDEHLPGPIMLQGDHGPISFRNIVITPAR